MEELLEWMELIEDVRQEKKVRHKLKDIIVIVYGNFVLTKAPKREKRDITGENPAIE